MIPYYDRQSKRILQEKIYGGRALKFLYDPFGYPLRHLIARFPFFSAFYGWLQSLPSSRKKIIPFMKDFEVDEKDFLEAPASYSSFNDFFIRKLKPEARPISHAGAIIPADGRYRFFQKVHLSEGFIVKGEKFDLATLLEDEVLAHKYAEGSMVMARLCPTDYHRFHFPCNCVPSPTSLINGWLYSVNPIALSRDIEIFTKNKRTLCTLETEHFGKILFMEIGATNVGSIHETYVPGVFYPKGAEKGYFSFGGSALILLFEPNRIQFSSDLLITQDMEVKCLMGQPMGVTK